MLLVNHGTVYTMEGSVLEDGYVLCRGGRILEVGQRLESREQLAGRFGEEKIRELDVSGLRVYPGLIESHCHCGITEEKKGLEGDDCNETTDPCTPSLNAIDAINPMDLSFSQALSAGITGLMIGPGSANVVGGRFVYIKPYGRSIDEMVVKDPAAMKVAFGENTKRTYGMNGNMPATRMAIADLLRKQLQQAIDYRDHHQPQDPVDLDMEAWQPVLRGEIPMKAHVHRADDILTAIRIGREFHVQVTLEHCTEGHLVKKLIRESGCMAAVGPTMTARNKIEVQYLDFKTVGELAEEGVNVTVITDHPVTLIQYLPICAGLAAKAGLGRQRAMEAITINAARFCGLADRVGSIAPGKDADMAIYDGSPMEVFTHTCYTIINGEVVWSRQEGMKKKSS